MNAAEQAQKILDLSEQVEIHVQAKLQAGEARTTGLGSRRPTRVQHRQLEY